MQPIQKEIPINGKYLVTEMQKFSDSGNLELSIDTPFVSFLPNKIILHKHEVKNDTVYEVMDILVNETEAQLVYYLTIANGITFLLLLNRDEVFNTSMPHLAQLTTDDGREGIMYGLHKSMFMDVLNESPNIIVSGSENLLKIQITEIDKAKNEEELIPYRIKDKWGFCAADKTILINCIYDSIGVFSNGLVNVKKNGKWGYINSGGEEIIPCEFSYAHPFGEELAWVNIENSRYFLNKSGELVSICKYTEIDDFSEGFARAEINNKYAFINCEGKNVFDKIYDFAFGFSEGLACVKSGNKYGYIDKTGKSVIDFKYDIATSFSDDVAYVSMGYGDMKTEYFINKEGEKEFKSLHNCRCFKEGLGIIKMGKTYGYINKNNEIEFLLDSAIIFLPFSEGLSLINCNGKYGYINKSGHISIDCIYEHGSNFINGIASVKYQGKYGFINKKGVQFWEN